jgi:hypothetical protein
MEDAYGLDIHKNVVNRLKLFMEIADKVSMLPKTMN